MPYSRLLRRAPLVVLAVLLAHSLSWHGLRSWTCAACVLLGRALGLPLARTSDIGLALPGFPMEIGISCTMVDVLCGAVPLLWPSGRRLVLFALGLMVLNLVRLVGGFWLVDHGVPWAVGHEMAAGVAFFAVLEWVARWQPEVHTSRPGLGYPPEHDCTGPLCQPSSRSLASTSRA